MTESKATDMDSRVEVVDFDSLRDPERGTLFEGASHGAADVSFFLVDRRLPGGGPPLHVHPYPEVFVVLEGAVGIVVDGKEMEARAGQVVVSPAGQSHRFWNAGPGRLRTVNIHPSARVVQTWVPEGHQA
jgi:mannose-6-phosphate isomerase-like protein (cupin superfamily)